MTSLGLFYHNSQRNRWVGMSPLGEPDFRNPLWKGYACFIVFFFPSLLLPLSRGLIFWLYILSVGSVPIPTNWPVPFWYGLVKMYRIHFYICIKVPNCLHIYPMVWMQLLASITGTQKISVPLTIVVSGIAKMFVGELVETGMHTIQFWIHVEISFQGWQLFTFWLVIEREEQYFLQLY